MDTVPNCAHNRNNAMTVIQMDTGTQGEYRTSAGSMNEYGATKSLWGVRYDLKA